MECPNCGGENVWLYEQVEIQQSVMDFDGLRKRIIVNREHEIVSEARCSQVDSEMRCADCDEVIEMPDDHTIELFPPTDLRTADIEGAQRVRKLVADREREEKGALAIVQEIHDILKTKFHGKKITKRLATIIQKAHPSWTVFYDNAYGYIRLSICGGDSGFEYSKRMDFLVAYDKDIESYDSAVFPDRAVCYYAGIKRNKARAAFLGSDDPEKLAIAVARLKAAKDIVQDFLNGSASADSTRIMEVFGENSSQFYG